MAERLKILFLSAEVAPFAKMGGLADVCGSLPKTLRALGHYVVVVSPAYGPIETAYESGQWGLEVYPGQLFVPTGGGRVQAGVLHAYLPGTDVPVYFIAERHLFNRPQVYGYQDDPYRFSFFSLAALDLCQALAWWPDVVHAHDWHAAPAVIRLATAGRRPTPTLYTIHNLAHQGRSSSNVLRYLGIQVPKLHEEGFGEVNFMARGIYHSTLINTVSPTYAREILTPVEGVGLDGLLRLRHFDVYGILNGIDYEVWNPATDRNLASQYDAASLDKRIENKRALQAELGLPQRDDIPLVAMVSRLDSQKGIDLAGHVVHLLMNNQAGEAQFVMLGTGKREYEEMFARLAHYHSQKMKTVLTYAGNLAPLIYAGSDLFLMPSRFEPCGLGQMIAMRYGCVPVARAVGGLADTVRDGITGFTFFDFTVEDFWNAVRRALYIYHEDPDSWLEIQRQGMNSDFSWTHSARGYQQLYEWAIARRHGY